MEALESEKVAKTHVTEGQRTRITLYEYSNNFIIIIFTNIRSLTKQKKPAENMADPNISNMLFFLDFTAETFHFFVAIFSKK